MFVGNLPQRGFYLVRTVDENPIVFGIPELSVMRYQYRLSFVPYGGKRVNSGIQCSHCGNFSRNGQMMYYFNSESQYRYCPLCEIRIQSLAAFIRGYILEPASKSFRLFCSVAPSSEDRLYFNIVMSKLHFKIFLSNSLHNSTGILLPIELPKIWLMMFFEMMNNPWIFLPLVGVKDHIEKLESFLAS